MMDSSLIHERIKPSAYPSLFSPDTDEELSSEGFSDLDELDHPPLLKLSEVIQDAPKDLPALLEILLPRLRPRPEVKGVSMEDQQSLGSILVGELGSQYSILAHQIDDPFLNPVENRKMHRGISVDLCTIIEQLYGEYIYKAATLNTDILCQTAAMSHLRAQLMVEANKRINILASRRRVIDHIRGPIVTQPAVERPCKDARLPKVPRLEDIRRKPPPERANLEQFSLGKSLEFKLDRFWMKLESGLVRKRIRKLARKLPPASAAAVSSSDENTEDDDSSEIEKKTRLSKELEVKGDLLKARKQTPFKLRRISSLPELWGEFLLCDLELTSRQKRSKSSDTREKLLGTHRPPSIGNFMDLKLNESDPHVSKPSLMLGEYTMNDLNDDLCTLDQHSISKHSLDTDELHPLLQARVHGLSNKQAIRLAEFEASMRKEEEIPTERATSTSSFSALDQNIPSVSTLDQIPYLTMHASESISPNPSSLHVTSELADSYDPTHTTSFVSTSIPGFESNISLEEKSFEDYSQDIIDSLGVARWDDNVIDNAADVKSDLSWLPDDSGGLYPQLEEGVLASPQPAQLIDVTEDVQREGVGGSYRHTDRLHSPSRCLEPLGVMPSEDHPQGAVVTAEGPSGEIVRTSDIRVSERTPLTQLRLKSFGPIYNELEDDWDSSMTNELDSSMYEGKEITAVYREIMRTLSNDHLNFKMEPTLEPSLQKPVEMSKILASSTLHHRRSQRVINQDLYRSLPHPWGDSSRQEWEESNDFKGHASQQHKQSPGDGVSSKSPDKYTVWLKKWKATINTEDFMKFCSKDESDYLRLVYHLYDSDDSDSEAEEEVRKERERLVAFHDKLKAKEMRKQQHYRDKNQFKRGSWNVNCMTMGGLGNTTMSSDEDGEAPEIVNQKASTLEAVQKILQRIWIRLFFPKNLQIDMAIKYSGNITQTELNKGLSLWESVCDVIELREIALSRLELFEMTASDPTRFFAKGQRGSASVRLEEARTRDKLHNDLDKLDKEASVLVQRLQKEYGDSVTYKGRSYSEKIRSDRLEMLYWLQQARRQLMLDPEVKRMTLAEYRYYYNPDKVVINNNIL